MKPFKELSEILGQVLTKKNEIYGDSFHKVIDILQIMFPNGMTNEQIPLVLFLARILDKCNRIATNKDTTGEDPAFDIAGYALLEVSRKLNTTEDIAAFKEKFKEYL